MLELLADEWEELESLKLELEIADMMDEMMQEEF